VKISRLLIVVLLAMILSAPATAAVSADGRYSGVYANLSAISSTGTVYAGDLLAQGKKQLARVVTELR
jgi:hypothetical protein